MTQDRRFRAADHEVRTVPLSLCRELVEKHHYARGGSNTAVYRHGLFRKGQDECLGIAWWLPPTKVAAQSSWDGDWRIVLSLSRLVIVPGMPTNAASFLIGRSIRLIEAEGRFKCLVTYADGWQGHVGTIYRATNWEPVGLTSPEAVWVDPRTGRMVARKAGPRTRTNAEMQALGYQCVGRYPKHKFRMILSTNERGYTTHDDPV